MNQSDFKRVKEIAKWHVGGTPPTNSPVAYNGDDSWATIADMKGREIVETKNTINGSFLDKKKTKKGSLLFSFKLSIGKVAFAGKDIYTNEAICSFTKKSKIDLNYFYYAAPVYISKNKKVNIYGADLLNQDLIKNAIVYSPNKQKQKEIANFLDKSVIKIDHVLNMYAKKIALLKEYKESLIYETITKGLDADVEMKESGVCWIKKIPAHWSIKRLKECVYKTISGGTPSATRTEFYEDSGTPWVTIGDMTNEKVIKSTKYKISMEGIKDKNLKILSKGTLLYSMYASVGFTSLLGVDATINQAILGLFIRKNINNTFLKYSLDAYRSIILREAVGTTQNNLNASKVRNIKIIVPPLKEQYEILDFIEKKEEIIESEVELLSKKIVLLDELKEAIIYESVTGKLDVDADGDKYLKMIDAL